MKVATKVILFTVFLMTLTVSIPVLRNPKPLLEKAKGYSNQDVAYLFDFLDPLLQKKITTKLYHVYKDALSLSSKSSYNKEITASHLKTIIEQWGWYNPYPNESNYAQKIIAQFDIDKSGSLNANEFLTLSVLLNKKNRNNNKCIKHCYRGVFSSLIDPIFKLSDENGDSYLTAEELFNSLKRLSRRNINRYNIFQCVSRNTQIVKFYHTDAANGFILKNQDSKESAVNLEEFRNGILLGYIDRQVEGNKFYLKDEINEKTKRWKGKGKIDIQCRKINNYIQKKYRNNKVERPGMADNQLALPSSGKCKLKGRKIKGSKMKLFSKRKSKGLKYGKKKYKGLKKGKYGRKKKGMFGKIKNKSKSFGKKIKSKFNKKKKYQKKKKYNKKKKEGIVKRGIKTIGRGIKQVGRGIKNGMKRIFRFK